jgi:hypothetical protein
MRYLLDDGDSVASKPDNLKSVRAYNHAWLWTLTALGVRLYDN